VAATSANNINITFPSHTTKLHFTLDEPLRSEKPTFPRSDMGRGGHHSRPRERTRFAARCGV